MKKNTIKAFTLVEMLIVIVIIGILIAALMPRMQSAQGRARDVARKNDLSQIQTAIVTSQQDKGIWPGLPNSGAADGISVNIIKDELITAGLSSLPQDPISSTEMFGLGDGTSANRGNMSGEYMYIVTTKNGTDEGGFVLMAKTEIEGGSNWAVCGDGAGTVDAELVHGWIKKGADISKIHPCTKMKKDETAGATCDVSSQNECVYTEDGQLRYILTY